MLNFLVLKIFGISFVIIFSGGLISCAIHNIYKLNQPNCCIDKYYRNQPYCCIAQAICVPSYGKRGKASVCGGKLGIPCPLQTDKCLQFSYGASYGHCCLGCPVGEPVAICKYHWECPFGFTCNHGLHPGGLKPKGVCCPKVKNDFLGALSYYKVKALDDE